MFWIHTTFIATEMVNRQSLWDRAFKYFIGHSMGSVVSAFAILPDTKRAISVFINSPVPNPTKTLQLGCYISPKQFFMGGAVSRAVAVLAHIVHLAKVESKWLPITVCDCAGSNCHSSSAHRIPSDLFTIIAYR
jgi:hypothetical protein